MLWKIKCQSISKMVLSQKFYILKSILSFTKFIQLCHAIYKIMISHLMLTNLYIYISVLIIILYKILSKVVV